MVGGSGKRWDLTENADPLGVFLQTRSFSGPSLDEWAFGLLMTGNNSRSFE